MQLADKVIIVTGAGDGIGRALCQRFAKESPRAIYVADIDATAAQRTANGVGGTGLVCDVADESQVRQLVETAEQEHGRVDLFCANAGIATSGGADVDNADWARVIDVNVMSHVYSARAILPGMIARGSGYLLHTASAAGLLTQIGSAPYAVTKHAAVAFAEWLAVTHHHQGIRVSCLCPMGVFTEMLKDESPAVRMLRETAISPEQVAEATIDGIAAERFLILPHAEVATFFQNKANDYDRWLTAMRRLAAKLDASP